MIDLDAFSRSHAAFASHMVASSSGVPFTNFEHPFLHADEIRYKVRAAGMGEAALQLDRWRSWGRSPDRIVSAVRDACSSSISRNLIEHRWGSPFSEVPGDAIPALADEFRNLFLGGGLGPDAFGPRFDGLADFLRDRRLGCSWDVMAYLAFLANPRRFFPVRPTRFEELARFYGFDVSIAGRVEWSRYEALIEIAEELKGLLAPYSPEGAIDIQSYMWVVAYLLQSGAIEPSVGEDVDWAAELERRRRASADRERIGLMGEKLALDAEVTRLKGAGREDLASRVELVATKDPSLGFDIRSFTEEGVERHVEVKTTTRDLDSDPGFWVSDHERRVALEDTAWTLVRVASLDANPVLIEAGNPFTNDSLPWGVEPSTWFVSPRPKPM